MYESAENNPDPIYALTPPHITVEPAESRAAMRLRSNGLWHIYRTGHSVILS